jgi:hypothetical protein
LVATLETQLPLIFNAPSEFGLAPDVKTIVSRNGTLFQIKLLDLNSGYFLNGNTQISAAAAIDISSDPDCPPDPATGVSDSAFIYPTLYWIRQQRHVLQFSAGGCDVGPHGAALHASRHNTCALLLRPHPGGLYRGHSAEHHVEWILAERSGHRFRRSRSTQHVRYSGRYPVAHLGVHLHSRLK